MPAPVASLISLPLELILEIRDYLPPDAILALKHTHSIFYNRLPLRSRLKNDTHSECARLVIRTYLSPSTPTPTHLRCILCKALYPASSFEPSSSPACVPMSRAGDTRQADVVELPQRLCSWHVGRLARIIPTESKGKNEWVSHMDKMCMHCGTVKGWEGCDCRCDSCWFRAVRVYTRYLNNNKECRTFLFWRNTSEQGTDDTNALREAPLWVRETCWNPGAAEEHPVITLPVRFETL